MIKALAKSLILLLLAGACSGPGRSPDQPPTTPPQAAAPQLLTPNAAACHAFLGQTISLSMREHPDVRGDGGYFFSDQPYPLSARLAGKLAPPDSTPNVGSPTAFYNTPPAVLREFRRQVLLLDTAAQRRFRWQPPLLGKFVFVPGTADTLSLDLARHVRFATPARQQEIRAAIAAWNREPPPERFVSYASLPLFSADGRYVLIVRGQAQQSIGWDSIFIYERTAQGWKIIDSGRLTTI